MILSLDVGGTNIDALISSEKRILKVVKEEVSEDLLFSITHTLNKLLKDFDKSLIKRVHLSTTIATNIITSGKNVDVAMITQSGLGLPNSFYEIGNHNYFISGYIDHRGEVLEDINIDEIYKIRKDIDSIGITNIAINSKFSIRNNSFEERVSRIFNESKYLVTKGSSLSDSLNFKRRIATSFLNSQILKDVKEFYNAISKSLSDLDVNAPIYILKTDGGLISLNELMEVPVYSIGSGPAASLLSFLTLFKLKEDKVYLLLDIGGTTTDIFFSIGDNYLFLPDGLNINNFKTHINSIYFKSIYLGGNTSFKVIDNNIIFGESLKSLSLGGDKPTVTDALNVLGESNVGDISINKSQIDLNTSKQVIDEFATILKEAVNNELDIINSKPIYTIHELINKENLNIDDIKIIGGPAKSLSSYISKAFNLNVEYPQEYLYANALGANVSKESLKLSLYADTEKGYLLIPKLGIKDNINKSFNLNDAKECLSEYFKSDYRIVHESSFNMIEGFHTKGLNIRVTMETIPGVRYKYE